jgi:tetratricopeptide (TPR) repeat protein
MVTAEPSQTGDEQADFERMLDAFKAGVERNIDGEDFDSHYDLGVAFREMGLLDEAVTQFQRASRAPGRPLRAIEALGQCFIDLGQPELALEALGRGVPEAGSRAAGGLPDEQLVGVLYLLGVASEQTERTEAAGAYFRRVLATDIQFRDASRRLAQLSQPPR